MDFSKHQPKTLEEAVDLLVADLRPQDREYILKDGVGGAHHGFGTAMRNGWGLWHGSELAQHFKDVHGLGHADDMSGMILSGVEAKVRGTVFDAKAEATKYHEYWRQMGIDPLTQKKVSERSTKPTTKYIANPVEVEIALVEPTERAGFLLLTLENGEEVVATSEMTARMDPKVGDYWVVQQGGYIYLNPKEVFERKYRPKP